MIVIIALVWMLGWAVTDIWLAVFAEKEGIIVESPIAKRIALVVAWPAILLLLILSWSLHRYSDKR